MWKTPNEGGRLKMAEGKIEKNIRLRYVVLMFFALTVINFMFANYTKAIVTYNDEYFYVNAARNIFRGEGPIIDGLDICFDKVLYSFLIAPAYLIEDAMLRVKIISLINCLLMSSSLFPIWLIGRDIELSRSNTIRALVITGVFPELSLSMSFMSENLFFPLVLFFIRFWLAGSQRPTKKNAVILGILGFLCCFCKMSFLAVVVSCVAFEIIFPAFSYLIRNRGQSEKLRSFYSKSRFVHLAVFIAVFVLLNILLNLTLFNGEKSIYQVRSAASFFEPYRFWYAVYAAFYYIAAIMISALILPFVYPVLQYAKLNEPSKKLFCFNVLSILMTAAVVIYTITPYEEYGTAQPEVHTRYFSHFILISFILFLKSVEKGYYAENKKRPGYWSAVAMAVVMPCMIFRGMQAVGPEQTLLYFYKDYKDSIGSLSIDPSEWIRSIKERGRLWGLDSPLPIDICLYAVAFGAAMFILVAMFHWLFIHRREKLALRVGTICITAVMLINSLNSRAQWRSRNSDDAFAAEIVQVNHYFSDNHAGFNMMYITGSKFSKCRNVVDTYLNLEKEQHIFAFESSGLEVDDLIKNDFVIEETTFKNTCGSINEAKFDYDTIEGFDYILIDGTANLKTYQLSGVTVELETDNFTLYRNDDPETLIFEPVNELTYMGGNLNILKQEYVSVDYVVTQNGSVDVNDVVITVNIAVDKAFQSLDIHVALENKVDSYQLFMARQNGSNIYTAAVNGEDELDFTVDVDDGLLSFEILLPSVKLEQLNAGGMSLINTISCFVKNIEIREAS